jgi:eukaryotic-like serine/threonine-protein kinase
VRGPAVSEVRKKLGQYEVRSRLGSGGMGEVWRARDPRLHRDVAIKVLPDALAREPDHLARFEREARSLAALNHPNIGAIYGLEEADGRRFLVLELVEGETLARRLEGGAVPVGDALRTCRQIAEALEAAHAKGIVHRDLKPANVMLAADGKVKVLDFGLAIRRPLDAAGREQTAASKHPLARNDLSAIPTEPIFETREGTILGTAPYMSPEQALGKPVDKRADLWSFGCVLYETLTGRRAFDAETGLNAFAAILTGDPDWERLPKETPAPARELLRRCLEKDPARRQRDAGDAILEIDAALEALSQATVSRAAAPETSAASAPSLLQSLSSLLRPRRGQAATSAPLSPPRLSQVTFSDAIEEFPAWSPDGDRLAFSRESGKTRRIFVKDLRSGEEAPVTRGDCDDIQPDWTADGRGIFFARARAAGRKLEPTDVFGAYEGADVWTVDLSTGRESRVLENAANPSCSSDGRRIAFDAAWAGPRRIWIADDRGRNPEQATSDASEAVVHVRPRWSPDGRCLVFQNVERTKFDIRAVDLASKRLSWVTNDHIQDICPVWSPSGFLYFSSYRSGGLNIWRVAVTAGGERTGLLQQVTTGAGPDIQAALSRDGKRLAFTILRQNADIWRLPISSATGRPAGDPGKLVATTREDSRGAWTPDGKSIVFNSDRSGEMNIWMHSLESGSARALTRGPGGDFQPIPSPDGGRVAFFSSREESVDVWLVAAEGGRPKKLTRGSAVNVNPAFSPDGRSIAYMSDEGGRLEVWVISAEGRDRRRLTEVGVMGHFLQWTSDGRFVVFRCPSGTPRTMRVPAAGGEPEDLPRVVGGAHMSFSPDETRILDVLAHKALWVSPLNGGEPEKVFEFEDPDSRIDYPRWSPDGNWVLFDRFRPSGGDVWMMEKFES